MAISNNTLSAPVFARWFYDRQKSKADNPELWRGWSTGLSELDELTGGIFPGDYILVAGPQKSGKSTEGLCMLEALGRQGKKVAYFSLEMSHDNLGSAIFSNMGNIQRANIRDICITPEEWETFDKAVDMYSGFTSFLSYGFVTPQSIFTEIINIEHELQAPLDAIFIDYAQLMTDPDHARGGRQDELAAISRQLKLFANRQADPKNFCDRLAVIAMAQVNRESVKKGRLDANSFLGSGAFERDMDLGLMIMQVIDPATSKPHPNLREISIVGARSAGGGRVKVWVDFTKARIRALADNIQGLSPEELEIIESQIDTVGFEDFAL